MAGASLQQNRWNTGQRKDSRSPFKGVVYEKRTGKWIAHIKINGRYKHLGTFLTAEEAAVAYQQVVLGAWKEIDDGLNGYTAEQQQNRLLAARLHKKNGRWLAAGKAA